MKHILVVALISVSALIACRAPAQHQHGDHAHAGVSAAEGESVLTVPPVMKAEHDHLHHQLADALAAGGKTAAAAKKVEAVLGPHFNEEDAYALPPLGLLESIAQGKQPTPEQSRTATAMADQLRSNYDQMLSEHKQLTDSLRELAQVASEENKPEAAAFAEALTLHAQNEEQILYPATLMIGEYLKLKTAAADKH
jgi:hypothetical protein